MSAIFDVRIVTMTAPAGAGSAASNVETTNDAGDERIAPTPRSGYTIAMWRSLAPQVLASHVGHRGPGYCR